MEDIIDIIVTETTNLIEITSQPTDEIIDVNIIDNREDVTLNVTPTVVEININSLTGNFGINWGEIEGTLSNQTDLQNALNLKADLVGGKVPSSQLPSYVDDVVEVANYASLPVTGETGKIYVTIDTNYIYRWTGSVYVEIKDSSAVWGAITGTLSNQTDLQNALNTKLNLSGGTLTGGLYINPANSSTVGLDVASNTFRLRTDSSEPFNRQLTTTIGSGTLVKMQAAGYGATYVTDLGFYTSSGSAVNTTPNLYLTGGDNRVGVNTTTPSYSLDVQGTAGVSGNLTAGAIIKSGGTSSQFLKADGSVDSNTYLTTGSASSSYVPYTGANASVNLGNNNIEINGTTAYVRVQGGGASGFISESAGAKMQLSPTSLFLTEKQSSPNYTKTLDFRTSILGASYTIIVPDASGTLALTSQLHNAVTIGTANGLTLSTQVLSLGLASSSANGALSSTDWTTFNNKQNALTNPVTGTGTSGIVAVFNGTSSITDSTIYANSTRVSIGADVTTTNRFTAVSSTTSAYAVVAQASSAANGIWSNVLGSGEIFRGQTAGGSYFIINNGGNAFLNGNLNVGDFASTSYRLNVVGTANFTGALSGTSATFSSTNGYLNLDAINSGANEAGLFLKMGGTNVWEMYTAANDDALNFWRAGGGIKFKIATSGAATFSSSVATTRLLVGGATGNFQIDSYTTSRIGVRSWTDIAGTTNNFFIQNGGNYNYGVLGVVSATGTSTGDVYGLGYTASAGTAMTPVINWTSSGNVGIGTTSPDKLLTLYSSAGSLDTGAVIRLIGNTANDLVDISVADTKTRIYHQENSADADAGYGVIQFRTNASPNPSFRTRGGFQFTLGSTDAMVISNTYTIGMGITPDAAKLSVQGTSNEWALSVWSNTTTSQAYGGIIRGGTNSNDIAFRVNNAANSSTYFNVRGDGNVGIGTTSPDTLLHVYGSAGWIKAETSSTGSARFQAKNSLQITDFGTDSVGGFIQTQGNYPFLFYTNQAERMRITSGGDLLINKTSLSASSVGVEFERNSTSRMTVDGGTVLLLNRLTSDGTIADFRRSTTQVGSISVTTVMTSYNVTSDYRLKEDFKSINGLDIVNKIKVYDYKWKADNSRMDGVLAHELQEVLPYAVTGVKDGEQMQQVDYSKIVPVMVQAIKDLKAELDTLKNK